MVNLRIPEMPDAITAEWLTEALRSTDTIGAASVSAVEINPLGDTAGFTGQIVRLSLRYSEAGGAAPASMIAKLPPSDPQTLAFGRALNFYQREAEFYRHLGDCAGIRTPQCYYSAVDPQGLAVLLLEDLTPLKPGDQVEGWTTGQVRTAVERLAAFHAHWWEQPELDGLTWMPNADDAAAIQMATRVYQYAWGPFLDRFGDAVPPEARKVGERLAAGIGVLLADFAKPPRTIMHGDYRMDNLFFGSGGDEFAVIDWQIACRGRGVFDVAYLMSQSGAPELRQAVERDMLGVYCDTLATHGVTDAGFDVCFDHYRQGVVYGLVYPVIVGGTLAVADRRAENLVRTVTDRVVRAVLDLDAGGCLA